MVRVDDKDVQWREGMTIADLLKVLGDPYPYAAARIDGRVISERDFAKFRVTDGSEVFLIPMIVGG